MSQRRPSRPPRDSLATQRTQELDQLCRFTGIIGATFDVAAMLRETVDPLCRMAEAERAFVALGLDDPHVLVPCATHDWELSDQLRGGLPASAVAALGTEALAFDGIAELPPALADRLREAAGYLAVVPLWAHARLRGVAIATRSSAPFGAGKLKLLTAAGRQLACATERSQLFADLQDSYGKLLDTQEGLIRSERLAAVGQLSATLAHEIRNPLATIFSAISQIRKHTKTDDISATLLDIAEEEATRLNQMVNGLLEFARPRKPSFERGRPAELAQDAVEQAAAADDAPAIDFECDPAAQQLAFNFDPELIHRALTLLITNASQAVEGGAGRVTVRVTAGPDDPGDVVFEVRDDGVGIPEELLARVCDPFFSTRPSGTGLGLPTVKRIIEDHGGTLRIDSAVGTGTTVQLFLPAKYHGVPVEEDHE